jgi:hypothetical protein
MGTGAHIRPVFEPSKRFLQKIQLMKKKTPLQKVLSAIKHGDSEGVRVIDIRKATGMGNETIIKAYRLGIEKGLIQEGTSSSLNARALQLTYAGKVKAKNLKPLKEEDRLSHTKGEANLDLLLRALHAGNTQIVDIHRATKLAHETARKWFRYGVDKGFIKARTTGTGRLKFIKLTPAGLARVGKGAARPTSMVGRLLALVAGSPVAHYTAADLAAKLNAEVDSVRVTCDRLVLEGKLRTIGPTGKGYPRRFTTPLPETSPTAQDGRPLLSLPAAPESFQLLTPVPVPIDKGEVSSATLSTSARLLIRGLAGAPTGTEEINVFLNMLEAVFDLPVVESGTQTTAARMMAVFQALERKLA